MSLFLITSEHNPPVAVYAHGTPENPSLLWGPQAWRFEREDQAAAGIKEEVEPTVLPLEIGSLALFKAMAESLTPNPDH